MSTRQILIHALGDRCIQCGNVANLQIHHIDHNHENPNLSNIQLLCSKCHGKAHRKQKQRRVKMGKGKLVRLQPTTRKMLEQLRLSTEKTPNDVVKRLAEEKLKEKGSK